MTRRRRMDRPRAGRHELTGRDRDIVHAVGRMGQATTDQLRRLFFTEPSTTSRRLAKLVGLRALDVHVFGLNEPNVYTLGSGGLALLGEHGGDLHSVHRSRVGRHLDRHLKAVNDLRVELVLATRGQGDVQVEAFHADLDLRRAAGGTPPAWVPDALVDLATGAGRLVLVVEVDLGSENPSIFAEKARTTVALWRSGGKCWGAPAGTWRPATFVPSSSRARSLARIIVEEGGGELWLVAELDRVRDVGILGPVFATADAVARTPRREDIAYGGALVTGRGERAP